MTNPRRLLINCDDLGYHPTINEAIVEILGAGVVRSASLMPAAPYFDDAVSRLRAAGLDGVGVHLTLGSEYPQLPMTPLSPPHLVASLVEESGRFPHHVETRRERFVAAEIETEFRAQIERARRSRLTLTHLDGHLFSYEAAVGGTAALGVAQALAREYRLPLRQGGIDEVAGSPVVHMLWGQVTDLDGRCAYYADFLANFRGPLTELIIHPAKDAAALRQFTRTGDRRVADYRFFSSAAFSDLVRAHAIDVVSWGETEWQPACATC